MTIPPRPSPVSRLPNESWSEAEKDAWRERELTPGEDETNREIAYAEMREWFLYHFEEPVQNQHWDNEDKQYVFLWGGPFEPTDVLVSEFGSQFPEDYILYVAEEFEGQSEEWAPTAHGDYYDHPEPDAADDDPDDQTDNVEELKKKILSDLNKLLELSNELPTIHALYGHNNPPSSIGSPPYTDEDRVILHNIISTVTLEIASNNTRKEVVTESVERLSYWSRKFQPWLLAKLDMIADELIKEGIKLAFVSARFVVFFELADRLAGTITSFLQHI